MESRNALKKKKKPARQGWIDAKDRYKGGLTREKPLDVICLNNTLKERKQNHLSKSRKAMDKIQHPLTVKSKPWQLGMEGIFLTLTEHIFQKFTAEDQFQQRNIRRAPAKVRNKAKGTLDTISVQHCDRAAAGAVEQEKRNERNIGNEETKLI